MLICLSLIGWIRGTDRQLSV